MRLLRGKPPKTPNSKERSELEYDIHKPLGAPDYALPDLPYAFKSLDDYDFIDVEEPEHELSEKEKDFKPDKTE